MNELTGPTCNVTQTPFLESDFLAVLEAVGKWERSLLPLFHPAAGQNLSSCSCAGLHPLIRTGDS
jgi:hypothetical protein